MGVSSSQLTPSSQHNYSRLNSPVLTAAPVLHRSKRARLHTPTMDDEAASEQLMSEARAPHPPSHDSTAIPLALGRAGPRDASKKKPKKLGRPKKSERKRVAISRTNLSPPAADPIADSQPLVAESPSKSQLLPSTAPSTQIEVPDSQVANDTPSLTPMTSGQAASPDAAKNALKRRKRKREIEANSHDETVPATPHEAANKDPSSLERRREQSGALHTPITPKALLQDLNAERSQRSQVSQSTSNPPTSAQRQREMAGTSPLDEGAAEHLEGAAGELPGGPSEPSTDRTPADSRGPSKKKKTKKNKSILETPKLDWDAPVRNLNDTPSQPFTFDVVSTEPSPKKQDKRKKSKKLTDTARSSQRSVGGLARTPSRKSGRSDSNRNYERANDTDDRTAADRALEATNELQHPPELRTGGDYSADEIELLRRAIRDFQQREGLDTADLVRIIQFVFTGEDATEGNITDQTLTDLKRQSDAFWADVESAGLRRKMKTIKDHVRATYHTYHRGPWSEDEDEQLRRLFELHPSQWKLIATQLNRLRRDVFNRWTDYVQHGEERVTKRWSPEEEENLVNVLSTACQKIEDHRAETGQPPLDDYLSVVNWSEVCKEMGNTRSRLQCQYKLRHMMARVPPPNFDIQVKPRQTPPPGEANKKAETAKKARRTAKRKSATAEDMRWGDKLDVLQGVLQQVGQGDVETEDQINWHGEELKAPRQFWSVPILQAVFRELCELCEPGESAPHDVAGEEGEPELKLRLRRVWTFIKDKYWEELQDLQYYNPEENAQADGDDAPHANSGKKRKRQSGVKSAQSKKQAKLDFKSKEKVSESDDAESERDA